MYLSQTMHHPLAAALVLAVGLVLGSFVNCAAYRRVHGGSVLTGRSRCPHCGHVLGASELVPLASWLAQKGRCRHCGQPIALRYPLAEAVCACALLGVAWRPWEASTDALWLAETVEFALLCGILLYASLADLDALIIPPEAVVAALAVRAAYLACAFVLAPSQAPLLLASSVAGGLVLGGGMLLVVLLADRAFGRDSMGGGDIKLLFVAGCCFGWQLGLACLLAACLIGLAGAALAQALARGGSSGQEADGHEGERTSFLRTSMPFGPAIAAACWVVMVWGPGLLDVYLGLFQ